MKWILQKCRRYDIVLKGYCHQQCEQVRATWVCRYKTYVLVSRQFLPLSLYIKEPFLLIFLTSTKLSSVKVMRDTGLGSENSLRTDLARGQRTYIYPPSLPTVPWWIAGPALCRYSWTLRCDWNLGIWQRNWFFHPNIAEVVFVQVTRRNGNKLD